MLGAKALGQLLKGQIRLLGDPTHDAFAKGIKAALATLAFFDTNMSHLGILFGKTNSRTGADLKTPRSRSTGKHPNQPNQQFDDANLMTMP